MNTLKASPSALNDFILSKDVYGFKEASKMDEEKWETGHKTKVKVYPERRQPVCDSQVPRPPASSWTSRASVLLPEKVYIQRVLIIIVVVVINMRIWAVNAHEAGRTAPAWQLRQSPARHRGPAPGPPAPQPRPARPRTSQRWPRHDDPCPAQSTRTRHPAR